MSPLATALGIAAGVFLASVAFAAKPGRTPDLVYTAPDAAAFKVRSIAMVPVSSFERSLEAEKLVQGAWGQAFAASGYRWLSATSVRDLIRGGAGGDSVLMAIKESVLKSGRVDSLMTPALCARLRVNALLSVRVDSWSQFVVPPEQAGKPSTSVQLHGALVDSTGRLLWSASGSETVEGLYHEPSVGDLDRSGTAGTRSTGLGARSTEGAPPAYSDVLDRLLTRWAKLFPARAADSARAVPAPAPAK